MSAQGHADTQNALAQVLRQAGIDPRSRLPDEPNFDLAWERNGTIFVAEVKSITDDNEEEQLRLGLGQVLRYRHRLRRLGHGQVMAVPVPERSPRDSSWEELCRELGVVLLNGAELEHPPMLIDSCPPFERRLRVNGRRSRSSATARRAAIDAVAATRTIEARGRRPC